LNDTGRLRPDPTREQAADLTWSMNTRQYFQLLTDVGHTPDQYAKPLRDAWAARSRGRA
jgi:hypothetical protein